MTESEQTKSRKQRQVCHIVPEHILFKAKNVIHIMCISDDRNTGFVLFCLILSSRFAVNLKMILRGLLEFARYTR